MHASVMDFVKACIDRYNLRDRRVLEVGSRDVNGTVRPLFSGVWGYIGVDMEHGPGVDRVANAHSLMEFYVGQIEGRFSCIVCTEMLEHDTAPWVSLREMRRCAGDGCILLLTCRGYDERGCFPLHGFPDDVYRFSVTGIKALLDYTGWRTLECSPDPQFPGVFAAALA